MRDTDADWNEIAHWFPFYGVLPTERFHPDHMTPDDVEVLYEWGRADVDVAVAPYQVLTESKNSRR